MAKKDIDKALTDNADYLTPEEAEAVKEVDYSTMSMEELLEAIGKAYADKDMKLMGQLSKLYTKKEAEAEKAKKEALHAELAKVTLETLADFTKLALELEESGKLDGADGIWFAYDFGAIREKGINPSCRLIKTARRSTGEGGGSGKSSYIANPAKSADLLAQVGENVMFEADTVCTIDKVEHTMPAGTSFKEAYDYSTNGGWRNRVRMALLKEAGII